MNELINKHAHLGEIKEITNKRKGKKTAEGIWYENEKIEGQR